MPQKYIEIPAPITLVNRRTREPLLDANSKPLLVVFEDLVDKILDNPMWSDKYEYTVAADAISDALQNAKDGVMILAEEDYKKLCEAVDTPKTMFMIQGTPQVMPGYGYLPSISIQIVPFLKAIKNAKDKAPVKEVATA